MLVTSLSVLSELSLSKRRSVFVRRPCHRRTAGSRGYVSIYREILFELVDGHAATPLFQTLVTERGGRGRIQALTLSEEAVTVLFDYVAPPAAIARMRGILQGGDLPCVLHADIILDSEKHLRFMIAWRRPTDHARHGVSLEHILLDTCGAGALLFGRVEDGIIAYKAASPGGRGLSEFLAGAQRAFGGRYKVKPVRAGPFKPGWEIDDAPQRVDPDEQALLSAALAQGYYDEPKRCGVRELGDALGVSKSVVARRLRHLERRALERMVS